MNRKGYCLTHQCQAEKRVITSKVWKDRGAGRGFGYITKRVTKYACKKRVISKLPQVSDAPVRRGSVKNSNSESRNLSKPGQDMKNLTGIEGADNPGFESEIILGQVGLNGDRKMGATGD